MKSLAILSCLCSALAAPLLVAGDTFAFDPYASDRLVNLRGKWRFSVGDDAAWASPEYKDDSWSQIDAPEQWEDEGYRDYNGYAWYRKTFRAPKDVGSGQVYIYLGTIDDVDQVFINGKLVGSSGAFPPHFATAFDHPRAYPIPSGLLKPGAECLVAVRVYDVGGKGGIDSGRLGLYLSDLPSLLASLEGEWRFQTGDDLAWSAIDADESGFVRIHVPAEWDSQGFQDYDGYGWYRKRFTLEPLVEEQTMVLLLGRIDDFDEVFLNGVKIASTGDLDHVAANRDLEFHRQSRGYYFPSNLLKEENVIAVRVYDKGQVGGIYEGPVGIISQADYIRYWERRKKSDSVFKDLQRLID